MSSRETFARISKKHVEMPAKKKAAFDCGKTDGKKLNDGKDFNLLGFASQQKQTATAEREKE